MFDRPQISVFLPYYNDQDYLRASINSVLSQTYPSFELILVNHASEDNSESIAHSFQDSRIQHIKMERNYFYGGAVLFREFLKQASGKYIKPYCADDVMIPDCLSILLVEMEKTPLLHAVFANMNYIDKRSRLIKSSELRSESPDRYHLLSDIFFEKSYPLAYPTALIRRAAIRDVFFDNVSMQIFDLKLFTNIALRGEIRVLQDIVVHYRIHDEQASMSAVGHPNQFKIISREAVERQFLSDIFANMTDLSVLQKVFQNEKEFAVLTEEDKDMIPFLIYRLSLQIENPSRGLGSLTRLFDILQQDHIRKKIERMYAFSIRDWRLASEKYRISRNLETRVSPRFSFASCLKWVSFSSHTCIL